jgi:hypothetical protein
LSSRGRGRRGRAGVASLFSIKSWPWWNPVCRCRGECSCHLSIMYYLHSQLLSSQHHPRSPRLQAGDRSDAPVLLLPSLLSPPPPSPSEDLSCPLLLLLWRPSGVSRVRKPLAPARALLGRFHRGQSCCPYWATVSTRRLRAVNPRTAALLFI